MHGAQAIARSATPHAAFNIDLQVVLRRMNYGDMIGPCDVSVPTAGGKPQISTVVTKYGVLVHFPD